MLVWQALHPLNYLSLQLHFPHILRQGLLEPNLALYSEDDLKHLILLPPECQDFTRLHHSWFHVVPGLEHRSSCMVGKQFYLYSAELYPVPYVLKVQQV